MPRPSGSRMRPCRSPCGADSGLHPAIAYRGARPRRWGGYCLPDRGSLGPELRPRQPGGGGATPVPEAAAAGKGADPGGSGHCSARAIAGGTHRCPAQQACVVLARSFYVAGAPSGPRTALDSWRTHKGCSESKRSQRRGGPVPGLGWCAGFDIRQPGRQPSCHSAISGAALLPRPAGCRVARCTGRRQPAHGHSRPAHGSGAAVLSSLPGWCPGAAACV